MLYSTSSLLLSSPIATDSWNAVFHLGFHNCFKLQPPRVSVWTPVCCIWDNNDTPPIGALASGFPALRISVCRLLRARRRHYHLNPQGKGLHHLKQQEDGDPAASLRCLQLKRGGGAEAAGKVKSGRWELADRRVDGRYESAGRQGCRGACQGEA